MTERRQWVRERAKLARNHARRAQAVQRAAEQVQANQAAEIMRLQSALEQRDNDLYHWQNWWLARERELQAQVLMASFGFEPILAPFEPVPVHVYEGGDVTPAGFIPVGELLH